MISIQIGISQPITTVTQVTEASTVQKVENAIAEDIVSPDHESTSIDKSKVPGVLRHLQAGKFNGVADVRLRLVFHEQITALGEEQAKARATEGSETLVSNIAAEIGGFSVSMDTAKAAAAETQSVAVQAEVFGPASVEVAVTEFTDAVTVATSSLVSGEGLDLQVYELALQTAFDSLTRHLEATLNQGAEIQEATALITNAETAAPDITTSTEDAGEADSNPTGINAFLDHLSEMFSKELTVLLASAESQNILPPLSEPEGNGKAYEKFKSLYDELSAGDAVLDDSLHIDIEA